MNKMGADSECDDPVNYKLYNNNSHLAEMSDSKQRKNFPVKEKAILSAINEKNEKATQDINDRVKRVDKLLANYVGADKIKESFAQMLFSNQANTDIKEELK